MLKRVGIHICDNVRCEEDWPPKETPNAIDIHASAGGFRSQL